MKNLKPFFFMIALLAISTCYGQNQNWPEVAKNIVRTTANVQPSDVVVISGGLHTVLLMEQIAAEVNRVGGFAHIWLNTDVALNSLWHEKPEANLADYNGHIVEWYKEADIMINLPASNDLKSIFKNVDPNRRAKINSNYAKIYDAISKETTYSSVYVAYPTQQNSEISGIDFEVYKKMHWAAIATESKKLSNKGTAIKNKLKGAKKVRITTPEGTDISFSMGDRYVFSDDGILSEDEKKDKIWFVRYASLPGGRMDFAPLESSVNGKVVVNRNSCKFEKFLGTTFNIKKGIISNLKAEKGLDCFKSEMKPHTGNKNTVSMFTIGLNPELKVIQKGETDFRNIRSEGYITLRIGGNNSQYKGVVKATGGFRFPLVNATLEIDGTVVIKDGKLMI